MEYLTSVYTFFAIGIMIISALIASSVVAAFFVETKSVRHKRTAANYVKKNSLVILERKDSFSYSNTTKHPKPKDDSNNNSFNNPNPFGGNAFGNPFGGDPFGGNPFDSDPFGGNHFGKNPFDNNPYGGNRFTK